MDESAVGVYETFIRDMLQVFLSRYKEFENVKDLSDFDKGRQLAYWEILDIIKTRKDIISDVLSEEEIDAGRISAGHFCGPLFRIESAPDCEAQGAAVAGLKVVDFDHFTQYPMNHHRPSSWASSWHF